MAAQEGSSARWVLIVEDDQDVRETIIELLEGRAAVVAGAANGLEAVEYLQRAAVLPAVILLDLMMPVMNGHQFRAEQLKVAAWRKVPVVVMSAHASAEVELALPGIDGVMLKPFQMATLFALVERYRPAGAKPPPVKGLKPSAPAR